MNKKQKSWVAWLIVAIAVIGAGALGVVFPMPAPPGETFGAFGVRWSQADNVLVRHHLRVEEDAVISAPTALPTGTPALVVDSAGVGNAFEVRDAATPVFYVSDGGAVTQSGNQSVTGAWKVTGPTAATTATPVARINNAADTNDLLVIEKDATPVMIIGNAGAQTHTGNQTITGAWKVTGPTAATTATPVARIGNAADANDLLVIEKDATPVVIIGNAGAQTHTGNQTITGAWKLTGPTAATTATPVVRIGNAADANDLLVIEKDATPMVIVGNAGASDIAGALTLSKGSGNALVVASGGSVSVASGDVTISGDSTNGNAGTRNEYIGLPRIRMKGLDQGTDAAAAGKTVDLDDDTPSGEFTASDADVTCSDDSTYYQEGSNSLKLAFSTDTDAGDGCHDAVSNLDWSDDESFGFWFYADTTLSAGDVIVDWTDDGGSQTANVPAYSTADTWVWVELALPAANGDKDVISDISFEVSSAGATVAQGAAFNVYIDAVYKWDSTEEDALGAAILDHGVLGVVDTENGDDLVLYTEYFVHYESGNDFVVWITNESASDIVVLYAY